MKLNGWRRIGVIVSIIWAIGAAFFERKRQVDSVNELLVTQLNHCSPAFTDECFNLAHKLHSDLIAFGSLRVADILFVSLGPILVGWLTAYLAIKVFFWVKTGFQSNV